MSAWTAAEGSVLELEGDIVFVLVKPLPWHIGKADGPVVTVPVAFRFELSIPRPLRWLFDPQAPAFRKAAALHDWLVQNGFDRLTSAAQFYQALKADGVSPLARLTMFVAVACWR